MRQAPLGLSQPTRHGTSGYWPQNAKASNDSSGGIGPSATSENVLAGADAQGYFEPPRPPSIRHRRSDHLRLSRGDERAYVAGALHSEFRESGVLAVGAAGKKPLF